MGIQSNNASVDQLQFQTQLLERLHNLSPFQPQRSPYNTPSPYAMGPSLLLPPCSGPTVSSDYQVVIIDFLSNGQRKSQIIYLQQQQRWVERVADE